MNSLELKLALGTVQLGMPYGIANITGQPDIATAQDIVAESYRAGVRYFDTAQAYGISEQILGRCFHDLHITNDVRVISKVAAKLQADDIEQAVARSLNALGVSRLWALLLHTEAMLDEWQTALGQALRRTKQCGLTEWLGVSIYSPEYARQALELEDVDAIQVPANIFDRRLKHADFFRQAADRGKTIFIRSVYLQGVALMDELKAPSFARAAVAAYRQFCQQHSLNAAEFAIAYIRQMAPEAILVIGAERPEQAANNCRLLQSSPATDELCAAWDRLWSDDDATLINPTFWSRAQS